MAKEQVIDGVTCRQHFASNTWINNDGTFVRRSWKNPSHGGAIEYYKLTLYADPLTGIKYVTNKNGVRTNLDLMVCTCYCQPLPQNAKPDEYKVEHKDGDMSNNHYKNLRWAKIKSPSTIPTASIISIAPFSLNAMSQPPASTTGKQSRYIHPSKYETFSDGTVWQDGVMLIPRLHIENNGQKIAVQPEVVLQVKNRWGEYRGEEVKAVDFLMADSGQIFNDKAKYHNSVILHKNYDYTDCRASNLMWVDENDTRYQTYQKKMKEDMAAYLGNL